MKICFVTTGDIKSIATAKRALGMANPLVELGWNVSILMEDTKENHHRVEIECSDKVKVFFFPHLNALNEIKAKNKLIKEIDPDFLYICAFVTRNVVGVFHRSRKLVEHSELQSAIPTVKSLTKLRILIFEYYSIFYSDGLINASVYLEDVYKKRSHMMLCGKRKELYSPYAYSENVNIVKTIDKNVVAGGIYNGRKIFCFLGSITRNYGAFTIIDAIKNLKDRYPELLMLFLGKGHDYEEACRYVKVNQLSDNIRMMGYISEEDISFYFSLIDYFISPMNNSVQDWARCPSKLYMYLPYNKPIITCKIGEPYEVLKEKGLYYEPSSVDGLAEKMKLLLCSDRNELGVDASLHTWCYRAKEFDNWVKNTFKP